MVILLTLATVRLINTDQRLKSGQARAYEPVTLPKCDIKTPKRSVALPELIVLQTKSSKKRHLEMKVLKRTKKLQQN